MPGCYVCNGPAGLGRLRHMKTQPTTAIYDLLPDGSITLERGAQIHLTCMSGVLWITREGNLVDQFLRAGESCEVTAAGMTLISALERARASIWEEPELKRRSFQTLTILRRLI